MTAVPTPVTAVHTGQADVIADVDRSDLPSLLHARSSERWGATRATMLIGKSAPWRDTLDTVARLAAADGPVLVTGETGVGKELCARALYLLSRRWRLPFLSVNCAQYQEGQLIASELFGHRRGSFTGAVADHRGVFEEADGGVVLLDEVGELSPTAQVMLLRVLGEGEIVPVGGAHSRAINVRVIAATARNLQAMVAAGTFREDLYYRLRYLKVRVPAVRDRGNDWELILDDAVERVSRRSGTRKRFSSDAIATLAAYSWPGNIREILGLVSAAFHLTDGPLIHADTFRDLLEPEAVGGAPSHGHSGPFASYSNSGSFPIVSQPAPAANDEFTRMVNGEGTFWDVVHQPFMQRELSRRDVRALIARGLAQTRGSYKRLLPIFGVTEADYLRFMDFLRHHDLKPDP